MIQYCVIDDEPLARERTIIQITPRQHWSLVGEAESFNDALQLCLDCEPDVCFIDLGITGGDGLQLAFEIKKQLNHVHLVFITASIESAVDAYTLAAADYLVKPVPYERMERCLDKIESYFQPSSRERINSLSRPRQLAVKSLSKIELINIDDIYWIHGASNYAELHLENRVVLHREPLSQLLDFINNEQFIRVHRSSIVNLNKVKQINSDEGRFSVIVMNNQEEVRISNAYRKSFIERLELG